MNIENNLKELKIEVTYHCPLACVHCSSEANENNALNMSVDTCKSIVHQAREMGVADIAFSGGEPLTWQGLPECVALCKDLGIQSTIYTSGNCESANELFHKLAEAGLYRAVFSVYSPVEHEHIQITRREDSFKNTLNAIQLCNSLGIKTEIHFVAMATNYKKLYDIINLAKQRQVDTVSVLRFVPQGRGRMLKRKGTLTKNDNLALIKMIKDIRVKGFNIRTGSPFNVLLVNDNPKCMAAKDRLIIAPDLRIYPCDAFKQIEAERIVAVPYACSLKDCSLSECWEKSTYLNTVRKFLAQEPNETCKLCSQYSQCLSGCLAQKFLENETLESRRDPACLKMEY